MKRILVMGKNSEISRHAFSAIDPSGMKPDAVASTVSRQSRRKRTPFTSPAAEPSLYTLPPGLLSDIAAVVSGMFLFGGLAYLCLVLA